MISLEPCRWRAGISIKCYAPFSVNHDVNLLYPLNTFLFAWRDDVPFLIRMTFRIVRFFVLLFSFHRMHFSLLLPFFVFLLFCFKYNTLPFVLKHCQLISFLFFPFEQNFYKNLSVGTVRIESHLSSKLAEVLNAEIALNTITDSEGSLMKWLRTTFLYTLNVKSSDEGLY